MHQRRSHCKVSGKSMQMLSLTVTVRMMMMKMMVMTMNTTIFVRLMSC